MTNKPAYSLVELLIVITIIALILLASIGAYRHQRELQIFKGAVRHIEGILKTARGAALAGKVEEGVGGAAAVTGSWGVYFCPGGSSKCPAAPRGAVIYFHDRFPAASPDNKFDQTGDLAVENYALPSRVTLSQVKGDGTAWEEAAIVFKPPRAAVVVTNNGGTGANALELEIKLSPEATQATRFRLDAITGNIEVGN